MALHAFDQRALELLMKDIKLFNMLRTSEPTWYPRFIGVNLEEMNLEGANFFGADLTGANLKGAILEKANLCAANLEEADLMGAQLMEADLRKSNLRGVKNFSQALCLEDCLIAGACLSKEDLEIYLQAVRTSCVQKI